MESQLQINDQALSVINNYFDKIYLLSIERNLHRIDACRENLKGLDFTVFIGADGKQLNLSELEQKGEYDEKLMEKNSGDDTLKYLGISAYYPPHPNMVACALTHKMAYQDIVKNGYKNALILEDDALLSRENVQYFADIIKQLPSDWDMLYLGYYWKTDNSFLEGFKRRYIYPVVNFTGLRKYNPALVKNGFAKPYSKNLLRSGTHGGAHAYAMTKRGAQIMLDWQSPIQNNPDLAFWEPIMQGKLQAYSAKPILFTAAVTASSIWNGTMETDKELK